MGTPPEGHAMTPPDVQLGLMLNLEPNWDGYGADRIDPAVVEVAQEFVRLLMALRGSDNLFVSPGRDGGVGIEWTSSARRFDLDLNPDGSMELLTENISTGAFETEVLVPGRFVIPAKLLRSLHLSIPLAGSRLSA